LLRSLFHFSICSLLLTRNFLGFLRSFLIILLLVIQQHFIVSIFDFDLAAFDVILIVFYYHLLSFDLAIIEHLKMFP